MPPRRRANCQICDETESKYACPKCAVLYCSVACYKQHKSYSCSAAEQTAEPFFDTRTAQIGSAAAAHDDDNDDSQAKGKFTAVSVPVPSLLASNEGAASAPGSSSHVRRGDGLGVIAGSSLMGAEAGNAETREIDSQGDGDAVGNDSDPDPIPNPSQSQSMSLHLETPRPLRKLASLKWPYVPDTSSYPDPLTRDDPKPLSLAQYEAIARSPAVRRALAAHPQLPALLRALDALRGPAREAAVQRVLGVAPSQPSFALAGIFSAAPHASPSPYNNHGRTGRGAEVEVGADADADEEALRALRALAEAVEGAVRSPAGAGAGDGRSGVDPLGLDWEEMEA